MFNCQENAIIIVIAGIHNFQYWARYEKFPAVQMCFIKHVRNGTTRNGIG